MSIDPIRTEPDRGREPMQRVRTGVTGLAAVVLIVALATAIGSTVQRSANASDAAAPEPIVVTGEVIPNAAEKAEPLEQLGVTPPIDKNASDAAAAAP